MFSIQHRIKRAVYGPEDATGFALGGMNVGSIFTLMLKGLLIFGLVTGFCQPLYCQFLGHFSPLFCFVETFCCCRRSPGAGLAALIVPTFI